MPLTETTVTDKIEIVGDYKIIQVRDLLIISRNGAEISRTAQRRSIAPNSDVSGETAEIQSIANLVHTDAIKKSYSALLASNDEST